MFIGFYFFSAEKSYYVRFGEPPIAYIEIDYNKTRVVNLSTLFDRRIRGMVT